MAVVANVLLVVVLPLLEGAVGGVVMVEVTAVVDGSAVSHDLPEGEKIDFVRK